MYEPAVPAAGVPVMVAVPVPGVNSRPLGKVPLIVIEGVGAPVVVMLVVPATVMVRVAAFGLVKTGADVGMTLTWLDATLVNKPLLAVTVHA